MNKNLNNKHGKGPQRGQGQNQENRQNDARPSRGSAHLNRNREPQQVESWINQNKDSEPGIHPVDSPTEKTIKRETDAPTMGRGGSDLNTEKKNNQSESWTSQNRGAENETSSFDRRETNVNREREIEKRPVELSAEKTFSKVQESNRFESSGRENIVREKGTNGMEPGAVRSDNPMNSQTKRISESETGTNSTVFHTRNPIQNGSKVKELEKAPVVGTALYAIAAILLIAWAVGFFYFNAGTAIHILLVLALVSVLIRIAQGRTD